MLFENQSDQPVQDKEGHSSDWVSENDVFDKTFEEIVKQNEKLMKEKPLQADPVLNKHNLIFGVKPN